MIKQKDAALEAMRWICILAVVLHHGISVQRHSPDTIAGIRTLQEWLQWCVPGFFLVSGFLQPLGRPLGSQFLARARRLLLPYVVVSILGFLAVAGLHFSGLQSYPESQTLTLPILARQIFWLAGFGPQMYFLPYLLLVWVLVVPVLRFVPARWVVFLFAGLVALQGAVWMFPLGVLGPGLDKLVGYATAFALGVSMRAWGHEREGLFALATVGTGTMAALATGQLWMVSLVVPAAMKWALSKVPLEGIVAALGKLGSPGGIYLWHTPLVLPACSKVLGSLGILDWPNYVVSCLMACAVSLAIGRILSHFRATRWITL